MQTADFLAEVVRERGPLTVAAFMEFALYDSQFGYYARVPQRSGRAGDFFTSVDVGALFGRLLAVQIAEMAELLDADGGQPSGDGGQASLGQAGRASSATDKGLAPKAADSRRVLSGPAFDLVEAGAGNGRLSTDLLRALRQDDPSVYERALLHLVEASAAARARQRETLGDTADRLVSSSALLPASYSGVLFANEFLDAFPVHQVVMREDGLREVYVDVHAGALVTKEGPPSTHALEAYLARQNIALEPGWRVEIGLAAIQWMREAARRLQRGFMILIDYGHPARELYSITHSSGTLTSFARHTMAGPENGAAKPRWLSDPGEQDITAHVDFTSVCAAAEAEGLVTLGFLDQTYFLLGLYGANPVNPMNLKDRLALKTLLMPGGLGSTMKVLIFGKGIGTPTLRGCSYRVRVT